MSKNKFISIIIFLNIFSCKNLEEKFSLNGTITVEGVKDLALASGFISGDFYDYKFNKEVTKVYNKRFEIEGEMNVPHAFYFITNTGGISGLFFLDEVEQTLLIDTLSMNITPKVINSKTNDEYLYKYLPRTEKLTERDEILKSQWNDSISDLKKEQIRNGRRKIREKKDEVLLNYVKEYPSSVVAMWLIARNFTIYGFKEIYHTAYSHLSFNLKETYCGKALESKLKIASITSIHGILPDAFLKEYQGVSKSISFKELPSRYTLVDFWASNCEPCIKQFPALKELYETTDRNYFDIIAISTDSERTAENWERIIQDKTLTWNQFLDENGDFSKKLMINAVPANFLLDNNGKILLKNFSVEELKNFLSTNQKKV
ncbi:thioredoxin-like domain-containing protein [Formosa sp. A9]|uniref:thioredoxin-like domain-containing protein n=1 Tax=Formosa sp. A9 TaxID=3442641 RepID=UPI003EBEC7FA